MERGKNGAKESDKRQKCRCELFEHHSIEIVAEDVRDERHEKYPAKERNEGVCNNRRGVPLFGKKRVPEGNHASNQHATSVGHYGRDHVIFYN